MNFSLDYLAHPGLARDIVVALIGLSIGSFLNVLALRTLAERKLWHPPSSCPNCDHRLGILDLVPVLSYLMLSGKCRYCKNAISWQYPLVELVTAMGFVFVLHRFTDPFIAIAMMFFVSVLIAICITDFREKLIPHEITYPSILIGLVFANLRDDLLPSLAGVGISYILFDFLAFYGLKTYEFLRGNEDDEDEESDEEEDEGEEKDRRNAGEPHRETESSWLKWGRKARTEAGAKTSAVGSKGDGTGGPPAIGISRPAKIILAEARREKVPVFAGSRSELNAELSSHSHLHSQSHLRSQSQSQSQSQSESQSEAQPQSDPSSQPRVVNAPQEEPRLESNGAGDSASDLHGEAAARTTDAKESGMPFLVADKNKDVLITQPESANPLTLVSHNESSSPANGEAHGTTAAGAGSPPLATDNNDRMAADKKTASTSSDLADQEEVDPLIDQAFGIARSEEPEMEEEFEVMGGGDAVLAGLIAAWLGLQNLGISLLFGFLFGCVMGSIYLAIEMHRAGILGKAFKTGLKVAAGLIVLTEACVLFYLRMLALNHVTQDMGYLPWIFAAIAGFGGIFAAIIWKGSSRQFSKPFPFGPALALGALVAVFWDPYNMLKLGLNYELFRAYLGHN